MPPPPPLSSLFFLWHCFVNPPPTITYGPMPSLPLAPIDMTHHSPPPLQKDGERWGTVGNGGAMAWPSPSHLSLYMDYLLVYFLSSFLPYAFLGSSSFLVFQASSPSKFQYYDYVLHWKQRHPKAMKVWNKIVFWMAMNCKYDLMCHFLSSHTIIRISHTTIFLIGCCYLI